MPLSISLALRTLIGLTCTLSEGARAWMAQRAIMEYRPDSGSDSLRLDVERPDDVAPLLRFVDDELAEIGGRERGHVATQGGKPRRPLGIGKPSVDLSVELVDDLCRRGLRCARRRTSCSLRNLARTRPRSGCPATRPRASR